MKSVADTLREARALIDAPEKWAKNYYAYTAEGSTCDTMDPRACKFCASGAIYRVVDLSDGNLGAEDVFVRALPPEAVAQAEKEEFNRIPYFNDEVADHADVLAAFDRAIALAEAGQ